MMNPTETTTDPFDDAASWDAALDEAQLERLCEDPGTQAELRRWLAAHRPDANFDFASQLRARVGRPSSRSPRQEPRFFYKGLASQPWFDAHAGEVAQWTRALEDGYDEIKREVLALRDGHQGAGFQVQPEAFVPRRGDWNFFYLSYWGRWFEENRRRCPKTYEIVSAIQMATNAPGVVGFSTLAPGARVLQHSDPINLRVRCHLGIVVPEGDVRIRVGTETRTWGEGKCIVFDDSFDHETWNNTGTTRIVLGVDFWHPALTASEREYLQTMYTRLDSPLYWKLRRHAAVLADAIASGTDQDPAWWHSAAAS